MAQSRLFPILLESATAGNTIDVLMPEDVLIPADAEIALEQFATTAYPSEVNVDLQDQVVAYGSVNGGTGAYDIFGRVINGHDLDTSLYIVNRNSMSPDYFDDPDLFGSLFTFDIDQTKKSVVLDVAQYYDYYMLDGQVAAVSSAITPTVNEGLQLATGSSTGWLMGKHPGLFGMVRASRR